MWKMSKHAWIFPVRLRNERERAMQPGVANQQLYSKRRRNRMVRDSALAGALFAAGFIAFELKLDFSLVIEH